MNIENGQSQATRSPATYGRQQSELDHPVSSIPTLEARDRWFVNFLIGMRYLLRHQVHWAYEWHSHSEQIRPLRRATITRHLSKLHQLGLIGFRQVGSERAYFATTAGVRLLRPEYGRLRPPAASKIAHYIAGAELGFHYLISGDAVLTELDRWYSSDFRVDMAGCSVDPTLVVRDATGHKTAVLLAFARRRWGYYYILVEELVEKYEFVHIWTSSDGLSHRLADEVRERVADGRCRVRPIPEPGRVYIVP